MLDFVRYDRSWEDFLSLFMHGEGLYGVMSFYSHSSFSAFFTTPSRPQPSLSFSLSLSCQNIGDLTNQLHSLQPFSGGHRPPVLIY